MATTDRYILEIETAAAERNLGRTRGLLGSLTGAMRGVGPAAAVVGGAVASAAAIGGIADRIGEMDNLAKSAQQLGATSSAQNFEGFQVAANLLGEMGVEGERGQRALRNMQNRLAEAAETGKGPAAEAFAAIRDRVTDANGALLDLPTVFQGVTSAMQDGTLSLTDARKIMGEIVGTEIYGGFQRLAEAGTTAADAFADVRDNSNIVSLDAAQNAEAFGDTMGRLQNVAGRLGTELVTALLPTLNQLAQGALEILPGVIDKVKTAFTNLEPVFSLIGTVLTEVVFPIMGKVFEILGQIASAIAPLVETALPYLKEGFEFAGNAIQFVIDKITAVIEWFGKVITKATEMGTAVKDAFNEMTAGIGNRAREAYEGVTGWFGRMYDRVVGNSIVPDMAKGVLGEFEGMSTGMVSLIGQGVEGVKTAFTQVAQAVGSKFEEITGISLSAVREQVTTMGNTISNAVNSLASSVSSRVSSIWNSVSSTASRIGRGVSGLFADLNLPDFSGFFANGGLIPPRSFGVVGERGPELVSGPANVTPMGNNQPQQVIYNIQAVDASSFRSLVARDPQFIHAVVQRGARRSGGTR